MTPLELALQSSRARVTRARLALSAARAELEAATLARYELEHRAAIGLSAADFDRLAESVR